MPMTPTFSHRKYITTLCPSGSERLRKLLLMIQYGKVDLTPLWTHHMRLDDIAEAYGLFQERRDGVLKIAITP